jgi:uncharacterized membrane protein
MAVGGKMKRNQKVQKMVLFSMFLAIEMVLLTTQLGYLRIGPLSATLMHIPVILAAILLGTKYGAALGLVFGLTSVWNATTAPGITSFVFSPFVTVAGMSGGFASLIIAIVPRVLLGVIAGILFQTVTKKGLNRPAAACISAAVATFCHTLMVLGMIALFYGQAYCSAIGIAQTALMAYLAGVIATNGLFEMGLAAICSMAISKAIKLPQKTVYQN